MIPNEYHQLVAQQILGCDIERLDAAVREVTGHGLMSYLKAHLPKKSGGNLKFRNFNLMRFAYKNETQYIGKIPAHGGCPTQVYTIKCSRAKDDGLCLAEVKRNGKSLFDVLGTSLGRIENCAINALHGYLARSHRAHKRAKKGSAE